MRAAVVAVLVFLLSFALLAAVGMLEAGSTEGWGLVIWSGTSMYFVFLLLAAIFVSATTHAVRPQGNPA